MVAGHFEEAEEALEALSLSGPLTVLYAALAGLRGELDTAFNRLENERSIDAWELRGWLALKSRHFDQAIRFYRRALDAGGPSPALLTNLGLAHAALGAPAKAISETRQALAVGAVQQQRVAFNLISFLFATGDADQGFEELRGIQDRYPRDIEPVFAEAHFALAVGDAERAKRRLRRARTHLWGFATEVQQAELLANLAYLQHYTGAMQARQAADTIISQMRKIDWKSTRVVSMLPVLLHRYSDLPRLSRVREEVGNAHPDMRFYDVDFHVAVLQDDLIDAREITMAWEQEALFAPEAAAAVLFVLTQIEDRYAEATKIGLQALKRMPAAVLVANNAAYSLVLCG